MNRFQKLFSFFTFSAMMLGFTIFASAQYRDQRGNGGNYTRDVTSSVASLRNNARKFQKTLDRELDRSRYDGTQREDNLNRLAKQFKEATDDLKDEYKGNRKQQKAADEARRVMVTARQLDRALNASRLGRNNYTFMNSWNLIERDLSIISRAFNNNYNGSYGRNRGNNDRYGRNDDRYGRDDDRYGRDDDRYGRDDDRYRNRRTNGNYDQGLASTISSLKYKAKVFEDRLDQDRYDRNGSNLEGLSDRFKNAVDDLEDEYDYNRGTNSGYNEAQKVLSIGEQLDREISNSRVGRSVKSDWNSIEGDLKKIADAYNYTYRGNNGRFGGLGDIFRNFPF